MKNGRGLVFPVEMNLPGKQMMRREQQNDQLMKGTPTGGRMFKPAPMYDRSTIVWVMINVLIFKIVFNLLLAAVKLFVRSCVIIISLPVC